MTNIIPQTIELNGEPLSHWRDALLLYQFALDEVNTKLKILNEECRIIQKRNPIEHMKSRVKTMESIFKKLDRKGVPLTIESARTNLKDIAGIRIICAFNEDIYQVLNMIEQQNDIRIVEISDYIQNPKSNGYRSLHVIIEIPVFLSQQVKYVPVEIQIRTIAMDFWASLEHKMYYKLSESGKDIGLSDELKEVADVMTILDERMAGIRSRIESFQQ